MTEFGVVCPHCQGFFIAQRPPRPFQHATPESVAAVPPDVRFEPKHVKDAVIVRCGHCGSDFHPAVGTLSPRYCSKSCARRAFLARKHGFAVGERQAA